MSQVDRNYHLQLKQFEELNRNGQRTTPAKFIGGLSTVSTHEFQLEVIAVDAELTLVQGVKPSLQQYLADFPFLQDQIPAVYADVVDSHVRNFCPVSKSIGPQRTIEDYTIGEEIGRGGMGVVYEAQQGVEDRTVAFKVLFIASESIANVPRSMAGLKHPNIRQIYDAGTVGDFSFVSMQLVRGETLRQLLSKYSPAIPLAVSTIIQVLDALAAAHQANIVHLDVKPDHIVVGEKGHTWLTDFGLGTSPGFQADDATVLFPRSPAYCSPEQLSLQYGERGIRSDIYSVGLVLYELLTGRRAFHGTHSQILDQLQHDPPRRLRDYRKEIPLELENICLRAIAKQPVDRFESMIEFREQLVSFAGNNTLKTQDSTDSSAE